MKYLIFVLMAVCVGCAYGVIPDQQDDTQHHPWERVSPIHNAALQAPQPQIDWGDQCLVSYADHYDLYTCTESNPFITVTGAPCNLQRCIVNDPCYVPTDGGMVTGTCVKNLTP